MVKYSLADYILSVQGNDAGLRRMFPNVTIGGQGSMIGSITVDYDNDLFQTESFETGGYVHNKNLSKVGKVTINISQLSESVATFKTMCNIFYNSENYNGFTLSLTDTRGVKVCTCIDCYLTRIPTQDLQGTAQRQTWTFTCGEINFD